MARRLLKNKLICKKDIREEIKLISGSETDYISPSGNVYKDYGNEMFLKKKLYINKKSGYTYCGITYPEGNKSRRVHILVAKAYIPNPSNLPYVGHKHNIKKMTDVSELYWTTASENTKKAFEDGLAYNAKGFDDNQSLPVDVYDIDGNYIETCGSRIEAAKKYKVSVSTVSRHCYNQVKSFRKNFYFKTHFANNV